MINSADLNIPPLGVDHKNRTRAVVEGANAAVKGGLCFVSSVSFDGTARYTPRAVKVSRATSATQVGYALLAANDAPVGASVTLVEYLPLAMDTSAGAVGDPVYPDATGAPTLVATVGAPIIGVVVTVGTLANGGAVMLRSPGIVQ